jgi:hypothetical protein
MVHTIHLANNVIGHCKRSGSKVGTLFNLAMDKRQLTGQNRGRVFNFRFGYLNAEHFWCYQVNLPNLKVKTLPKQLLGSLPLVIALPNLAHLVGANALFVPTSGFLALIKWTLNKLIVRFQGTILN